MKDDAKGLSLHIDYIRLRRGANRGDGLRRALLRRWLRPTDTLETATPLVQDLALDIPAGVIHTLMGPSGSGKSLILSVVAGTLDPALCWQGRVRLHEHDLSHVPTHQRSIGLLFQDDLLFAHMNVAQNILFALPAARGFDAMDRVQDALAQAGLAGYAARDPATLSGGQRARVALLRCLLAEPKAVLLDEPFGKLDTDLRAQFRQWVFAQIRARHIPALLVTHDAADIADPQALTRLRPAHSPVDATSPLAI